MESFTYRGVDHVNFDQHVHLWNSWSICYRWRTGWERPRFKDTLGSNGESPHRKRPEITRNRCQQIAVVSSGSTKEDRHSLTLAFLAANAIISTIKNVNDIRASKVKENGFINSCQRLIRGVRKRRNYVCNIQLWPCVDDPLNLRLSREIQR